MPGQADIGALVARLGINQRQLDSDLRRSNQKLSSFARGTETKMARAGAAVSRLGAMLGVAVGGAAAVAGFRKITQVGVQFEQTMTTVGGVMRATGAEMEMLTAKAREMGAATEWSASQAGSALQFLGMAGFQATEAAEALPGVLDLATAGNIELGRAADIASNALTAMQLPVEELSRVNDVFVGTITRSNVNMEMMAEAFKYAAPVARAFGYSIEEVSALVGMLGNAGIQGSMAGTQLAMAIQRASEVSRKYGYETTDLVGVLERMAAENRDVNEILDVFSQRAGRAALVLVDATEETREFTKTLENAGGEAKALADKMRSTTGMAFKELQSVIEEVAIAAFAEYGGELRQMIKDTTGWIRENKDAIVGFLGGASKAVVGIVKVLGGISSAFFDIAQDAKTYLGATRQEIAETEEYIKRLKQTTESATTSMSGWWSEWAAEVAKGPDLSAWEIATEWIKSTLQTLWAVAKLAGREIAAVFNLARVVAEQKHLGAIFSKTAREEVKQAFSEFGWAFDKFKEDADEGMIRPAQQIVEEWEKAMEELRKTLLIEGAAAMPPSYLAPALPTGAGVGDAGAARGGTGLGTGAEDILAAQVQAYQEIIQAGELAGRDLLRVWQGYMSLRTKQIHEEYEAFLKKTGDEVLAEDLKLSRLAELNAEYLELVKETAGAVTDTMKEATDDVVDYTEQQTQWMLDWAHSLSRQLHGVFSDSFFDLMKGEWKGLMDYLKRIGDIFLRYFADKLASTVMKSFDQAAESGGNLFGMLTNLLGKASGGYTIPTTEFVGPPVPSMAGGGRIGGPGLFWGGEHEPEYVIPESKLGNANFMERIGLGAPGGGTVVNMTVVTRDAGSFRDSRSQIMSDLAVGVDRARRRNL